MAQEEQEFVNDYGEDKQKLLIDILLSSEEIFARCQNIISSKYFVNKLRPAVRFIMKYSNEFRVLPKIEHVIAETGINFAHIDNISIQHQDSFLKEIEGFCKNKALALAVTDSVELIEHGNYGEVEKRVREAILISLQSDLGTNYFEDPRTRLMRIKSRNGQMTTGWKAVDDKLYGGVNRGEITIWCGGSGCVTADTKVKIIKLLNIPSEGNRLELNEVHSKLYNYVRQYYTASQIDLYCAGNNSKLDELWNYSQPVETTIKDLIDKWEFGDYLIDSPDGYIPVVDTIVKQKIKMYLIKMQSGKSLTCSYDHFLQKVSNDWIYAQSLNINDELITVDGIDKVIQIQELPGDITYDVEVGHENHRFYTNGISSHNSGKSLFLQNISLNLVKQGHNVIYITLELSEDLTSMRMDSMLTDIGTREIFRNLDAVEIKVKQAGFKSGSLHIKQLPQGSSCNDIKVYLKNYEIETQKRPDILVVDYLDLLFPNNKKIDPSNLFTKDKFVTEELRGLGVERNMCVQTASQLNRSSVTEQEHDHSMISGGISKIQGSDNVISIFASAAMKERGQYQLQFLKTRSSSGVGSKVYLGFDPNNLRIFDLDDDAAAIANSTNGADVFNELRRKNSTAAKLEQVTSPPAPAKNLESLRNLIRRT